MIRSSNLSSLWSLLLYRWLLLNINCACSLNSCVNIERIHFNRRNFIGHSIRNLVSGFSPKSEIKLFVFVHLMSLVVWHIRSFIPIELLISHLHQFISKIFLNDWALNCSVWFLTWLRNSSLLILLTTLRCFSKAISLWHTMWSNISQSRGWRTLMFYYFLSSFLVYHNCFCILLLSRQHKLFTQLIFFR